MSTSPAHRPNPGAKEILGWANVQAERGYGQIESAGAVEGQDLDVSPIGKSSSKTGASSYHLLGRGAAEAWGTVKQTIGRHPQSGPIWSSPYSALTDR